MKTKNLISFLNFSCFDELLKLFSSTSSHTRPLATRRTSFTHNRQASYDSSAISKASTEVNIQTKYRILLSLLID